MGDKDDSSDIPEEIDIPDNIVINEGMTFDSPSVGESED